MLLARMTAPSLCLMADSTTTSILPRELPNRSEMRTRTLGDDSDTVGGVSRVIETGMWNLLVVKTFRTSRRWYAPLA